MREGGREGGRQRKITQSEDAASVSYPLCLELGGECLSVQVLTDNAPHTGYQAHHCRGFRWVTHHTPLTLTHILTHIHLLKGMSVGCSHNVLSICRRK